MRIFRKRKKFGNFQGAPEDAAPIPDVVYQMGAEVAAQYAAGRSRPQNPYGAVSPVGQEGIYGFSPIPIGEENHIYETPRDVYGERVRSSSPLNFIASALGIGRSGSRERYANPPMDDFGRPVPPGTPVKFRRRPASPEFLQARVPSPLHFAQQSRPSSPDVARRLHRAQVSQELQQMEKEQRRQQQMLMMNQIQYNPQYQQVQQPYYPAMNPYANFQAYPMMQQPQMYSFY